jgi:hypothetical protein
MIARRAWHSIRIVESTGVTMNRQVRDLSTARVLTGGAMIVAGALLALQAVGHSADLTRSWPLFIIVLAFVQLATTLKERRLQGWSLLLAGDWLFANTMTDWAYVRISVPLLLAGIGLMIIIRGIRDYSEGSDENHYATQ